MSSAESLLHLAALASGLSIAYVGLDKIHPADRKLDGELDFACKNWALLFKELELDRQLKDEEGFFNEIYNINAMYLLLFIAQKSDDKLDARFREKWRPAVLYILRLYHFPLFGFFRHKIDFWIVTAFALVSTILLVFLTSDAVYDIELLKNPKVVEGIFWYYTINIFFIFGVAFCSSKLFSIRKTCSRLEEEVRVRAKRMAVSSIDSVTNALTAAAKRLGVD